MWTCCSELLGFLLADKGVSLAWPASAYDKHIWIWGARPWEVSDSPLRLLAFEGQCFTMETPSVGVGLTPHQALLNLDPREGGVTGRMARYSCCPASHSELDNPTPVLPLAGAVSRIGFFMTTRKKSGKTEALGARIPENPSLIQNSASLEAAKRTGPTNGKQRR